MTIEITSAYIQQKTIVIEAIDVSEENLQRLERQDGGEEKICVWNFDTTDEKSFRSIRYYLRKQKAIQKLKNPTWGDVLNAIRGTIVQSPSGKYRVYD